MTQWIILGIFSAQGLAMVFDEFYYHIRRDLPLWERVGHPVDTVSVLVPMLFMLANPFSMDRLLTFTVMALISCLMVTKDEFVHSRECEAGEQWLHSLLFVLHPLSFVATAVVWAVRDGQFDGLTFTIGKDAIVSFIEAQTGLAAFFLVYQLVFWNTGLRHLMRKGLPWSKG